MKYFALCLGFAAGAALADPAQIVDINARENASGWRFDVTIAHPDTGWDHYADGWRVESEDGQVLGTRILAHPHVNEQPFTRSLGNVWIPPEISQIFVRSKCNVDGWAETTTAFTLER